MAYIMKWISAVQWKFPRHCYRQPQLEPHCGGFVNLPLEQSLFNIVDCLDITEGEAHSFAKHVFWSPGPLELLFDFGEVEYNLQSIFFGYYFVELYDIDQIVLEFFDLNGELTRTYTVFPIAGAHALGQNTNDIVAETLDLPAITKGPAEWLLSSFLLMISSTFQTLYFGRQTSTK